MIKPSEFIFSSLVVPLVPYTSIVNCLLGIYTWISPKYLRLKMPKIDHPNLSLVYPMSVNGTTIHLMAHARNLGPYPKDHPYDLQP